MDPPPITPLTKRSLISTDSNNGRSPTEGSSLRPDLIDHNSKRIRLTLPPIPLGPPQQSTPAQPPSHNNVSASNGLLPPFPLRPPIFSSQKQSEQINDSLPPVLTNPYIPPPLSIPQDVQELPSIESFANDDSLNMQGIEERRLGYVVYNPKEILPPLEFMENGLLEVWIPSQHLTWDNTKVRKRWLWGTDVYTDDSDVVAVLIHTGHFMPKPQKPQWSPNFPDYDLGVTIRVLPKLIQYTSCSRNRIKSRSWGNHHGVSFKIESVRKMKEGEAISRARGGERKQRLQRFHRLKRLAFGDSERDNSQLFEHGTALKFNIGEQSAVLKFNIDGDPCFKYSPHLMANQENLAKQFRKEVMFLENDEERFEISYDPRVERYRVAVVLPSIQLNETQLTTSSSTRHNETNPPILPLEKSNLEEILRDDLFLQDIEWVNVGVIVKDRVNTPQSLLIVLRRVFWRKRTHEVVSSR
ncbi:14521_t:CDS:2 [Ambispora leptoticha]|uniref:14521_t:CDS:1 n=1 Tax=Ambispora leptoticha TaxID=144679 RepID=A0A9N8VFT9_9GLOM|nr:14521_t:CDS:2 [Ambispora leptoticha]